LVVAAVYVSCTSAGDDKLASTQQAVGEGSGGDAEEAADAAALIMLAEALHPEMTTCSCVIQ